MGSKAYRQALEAAKAHHLRSKTYSGKLLRPHKFYLSEMIGRLGVGSILDYGAGKGSQYLWVDPADGLTLEQAWGVQVVKYDPAWEPYSAKPTGQFDLVICSHVLGSIPIDDLGWVFGEICAYAGKAVFIAEQVKAGIKKPVHGDRAGLPDWDRAGWVAALEARMPPAAIEVHLSTTTLMPDGQKITERGIL